MLSLRKFRRCTCGHRENSCDGVVVKASLAFFFDQNAYWQLPDVLFGLEQVSVHRQRALQIEHFAQNSRLLLSPKRDKRQQTQLIKWWVILGLKAEEDRCEVLRVVASNIIWYAKGCAKRQNSGPRHCLWKTVHSTGNYFGINEVLRVFPRCALKIGSWTRC